MSNDGQLLGVALIIRHGDRQEFWQNPDTYSPTATQLTPLGNQQEFQLGSTLRSLYLNASSPSYIANISTDLFDQNQIYVRADFGGEDMVIYDSCVSVTQGMWPVTSSNNITIANGTTIVAPLGGYQYVPVDAVDPDEDVSLEGFDDCNTFDDHTTAFYNSTAFQQKAQESADFLNALKPYLGGRSNSLQNMWNIYDYVNVQSVHNSTFAQELPSTFEAQARDLANWHEYNVFSSSNLGGIGNIAAQAMLPTILVDLSDIANSSNPTLLTITEISYKPFLSLFNMTGVAAQNPELAGLVNYAAAVALEVRQSSSGQPTIRFNFKNGTDEDFVTYNFLNQNGDVPMSTFVDNLAPYAVNTTADWCSVCSNSQDRGCAALTLAEDQGRASAHTRISPVGAGFLGAGLTVAVSLLMLGALAFFGFLSFGKRRHSRKIHSDDELELRK
ncbi:phosphoglycerate mutase-like protein [Coniophora puteana RWD-64-598 SS2]|uniref:Phosphoglycerate mutase-like protein n=1 Tax=Coniophora puteana (strain RWD-64-598) TaxID=741705 RepID=A0A5M3MPZ5_CONPW|nr:phosphoglycerate mutase-like protein [Coniophora puteana RWD-64-598 SS2]EIW81249.1 phosphoglycerate mutase-like protein [Coniophora puteana RWD-64-598 SS2]